MGDARAGIERQIKRQIAADFGPIGEVERATAEELAEHDRVMDEVRLALEKARVEEQLEIDEVQAEHAKQIENRERAHAFDVSQLMLRIESANGQQEKLRAEYAQGREDQLTQDRAELAAKIAENGQSDSAFFADARARADQLGEIVARLSREIVDAQLRLSVPEQREAEQKRIEAFRMKLKTVRADTEAVFDAFIVAILEAPNHVVAPEVPEVFETPQSTPRANLHSSRSLNNSNSIGLRRDFSILLTPVEPKGRKRPQVLVTPQYF
jgi:hypothetical protein